MEKRYWGAVALMFVAAGLTACGGSSGGNTPVTPPVTTVPVSGNGVKGPMAGAQVSAFVANAAASDLKGADLGQGETDSATNIINLEIPDDTSGLVLLEFAADSDTVDISTGAAPILTRMVTVVDATRIMGGEQIFATPLTSLAVNVAAQNADQVAVFGGDGNGAVSASEFENALVIAGQQVASTFGFGMLTDVDIFTTSPLVTADTVSAQDLEQVASYRTAIEASGAVIQSIADNALAANPNTALDSDSVLAALADDLADGRIDGQSNGVAIDTIADAADYTALVSQDPMLLDIPGTTVPVSDVESILADETATTGQTTDTTALTDGSIDAVPSAVVSVPDTDFDGVRDDVDNCVVDRNTQQDDFDQDQAGDACDADDDNDGVDDSADAFPLDPEETTDTDNDGIGNNADADDDNDGVDDSADAFPLDPEETTDTDSDGIGNNADTDDDNDGVDDSADAFPLDPTETTDTDGDGIGDNGDTDDDGDGIEDGADNCPTVANPDQTDTNGDGVGDACTGGANWDNFTWDNANWQ